MTSSVTGNASNPDVLIVGAGPSGSSLATHLARRGWHVRVVDKARFPRPKPCGEFISPGAVRALGRLGLPITGFAGTAAQLRGWSLQVGDRSVSANFKGGVPGLSLPRSTLDAHLVEHAEAGGADVQGRTRFVRCSHWAREGDPAVELRTPEGSVTLRPRVLVGAGGLRCPVSAQLGVSKGPPRVKKVSLTSRIRGVRHLPDVGRLFVRGDLTVGMAPSDPEGEWWNATVVVPSSTYGRRIATDASRFFRECLAQIGVTPEEVPGPSGEMPDLTLWTSGPFDRPRAQFYRGRTVLVGDGAGYFDPFTGQGIYQALRSGEVLAGELHRALSHVVTFAAAFDNYSRVIRRERRATTWVQRAVDWALSEERQDSVIGGLIRFPRLYGRILDITTDSATLWRSATRPSRTVDQMLAQENLPKPSPTHPYAPGTAN